MEKVSKINILFNFSRARDNKKESRPTPGGKSDVRAGGGLPPNADKNKKGTFWIIVGGRTAVAVQFGSPQRAKTMGFGERRGLSISVYTLSSLCLVLCLYYFSLFFNGFLVVLDS